MEWISGNVFIRPMHFEKAGQSIDGHAHNFDHTTYVCRGAIRIEKLADVSGETFPNGKLVDVGDERFLVVATVEKRATDGHNHVLIKAGVRHRITALADDTMAHCIYAHRSPQGDVVLEYDGWADAYR